jgi:hypothetical protein
VHVQTLERHNWQIDRDCNSRRSAARQNANIHSRDDVYVRLRCANLGSPARRELKLSRSSWRPSEGYPLERLLLLHLNRGRSSAACDVANVLSCHDLAQYLLPDRPQTARKRRFGVLVFWVLVVRSEVEKFVGERQSTISVREVPEHVGNHARIAVSCRPLDSRRDAIVKRRDPLVCICEETREQFQRIYVDARWKWINPNDFEVGRSPTFEVGSHGVYTGP